MTPAKKFYIKKWGRFKMVTCTEGIGEAPRKTKQTSVECLQTTFLRYFNAKSTLKVPLAFNKVEKMEHKNFDFVHLLSFLL